MSAAPEPTALSVLKGLPRGATVDELHALLPGCSRVSVWRALVRLKAAGKVRATKGPKRKGRRGARPMVWRAR